MFVECSGKGLLSGCEPLELIDPFMKFIVFPRAVFVIDLNNAIFPDRPVPRNCPGGAVFSFQGFTEQVTGMKIQQGHRGSGLTAFISEAGKPAGKYAWLKTTIIMFDGIRNYHNRWWRHSRLFAGSARDQE